MSAHMNGKPAQTRSRQGVKAVLSTIGNAGKQRILLSGHVRPDGDSLGCMIAMARLLRHIGHQVTAVADKATLGAPGFLTGTRQLTHPDSVSGKRFDLAIAVDCGAFDRLPDQVQAAIADHRTPVVNIDHHVTNTRFGQCNWIDARASSTGEMVWRLARRAGWPLDQVSAEALWVALITDTGRFAYEQTTPATMRCAADLLRHGVRTAMINDRLFCSFSRVAMELKRRAFCTLTISADNEVAWVSLTGRDFEEIGGTKADAEDVVDIPRGLEGNRVALFFYGAKADKGETRVSVRTRAPLDATRLAAQFNGGGHERAAGFTIMEPLRSAQKTVIKSVMAWLNTEDNGASTLS